MQIIIALLASCGRRDTSAVEYYQNVPDVEQTTDERFVDIKITPVLADTTIETSYVGTFWTNGDALYFSDEYYNYVYNLKTDGSIIARHVGRGNGPGEVPHFRYTIPFDDGYFLFSDGNSFFYQYDRNWQPTNTFPILWGWEKRSMAQNIAMKPKPDNPMSYTHDSPWPDVLQQWDSDYMVLFIMAVHPFFNQHWNTGSYYEYSRIFGLVNKNTGEVEKVLGRRSPVYSEQKNLPNMDHIGYAIVEDTAFVTFRPDSLIYMIDKINDCAIGKFGKQGRNMNTDYVKTQTYEEANARWREDEETFGYYTYLRYDAKHELLFRGYTQGSHSQHDGLQIYKNHALIGDFDVPKGFSIVGFCNDQLIASIEDDGESESPRLYFYIVNLME